MQTGDRLPEKFSTICRPIYKHRVCGIKVTKGNNEVDSVLDRIRNHPNYKNQYRLYCEEIKERGLTDWKEIRALGKKKDGWKTFIKNVKSPKARTSRKEQVATQTDLFESEVLVEDENLWDKIEYLFQEGGPSYEYRLGRELKGKFTQKECIRKDLMWLIGEMRKPQKERYKYYRNVDGRNNRDVIEKIFLLRNAEPYYSNEIRQIIKEKLLSLYCSNG